ncbi:hypothetical protein P7K49_029496 [Saguinus oedipus]|uniref:Uncharacterized protein n=1 Tax=Saguinus oedipus TaxID=9490 RepID=A0ABQ9U7C9_SAGOE|nr:hypothetical protein P7K49_029496 [Saguinus oedipus]
MLAFQSSVHLGQKHVSGLASELPAAELVVGASESEVGRQKCRYLEAHGDCCSGPGIRRARTAQVRLQQLCVEATPLTPQQPPSESLSGSSGNPAGEAEAAAAEVFAALAVLTNLAVTLVVGNV